MELKPISLASLSHNKTIYYSSNTYAWSNYHLFTDIDKKILISWIDNKRVSLSNYQGKLYFPRITTFPRYKFTEYVRENNNLVRKVRDLKNADAIVLDIDEAKKIINDIPTDKDVYNIHQTHDYRDSYTSSEDLAKLQSKYTPVKGYFICESSRDFNYIAAIMELYNQGANLDILNVYDISNDIKKSSFVIDIPMSENVNSMLAAHDPGSVKLGMDLLCNCELDMSLLQIMLAISKNYNNIRNNTHYHTVNYKSFIKELYNKGINHDILGNYDTPGIIQLYLQLNPSKRVITEDEADFIKYTIKDYIGNKFSFTANGFKISSLEIDVNIDESKVIKKNKVEELEEVISEDGQIHC